MRFPFGTKFFSLIIILLLAAGRSSRGHSRISSNLNFFFPSFPRFSYFELFLDHSSHSFFAFLALFLTKNFQHFGLHFDFFIFKGLQLLRVPALATAQSILQLFLRSNSSVLAPTLVFWKFSNSRIIFFLHKNYSQSRRHSTIFCNHSLLRQSINFLPDFSPENFSSFFPSSY